MKSEYEYRTSHHTPVVENETIQTGASHSSRFSMDIQTHYRSEHSCLPLHDLPPQVLNLILQKVDSPVDIVHLTLVSKSLRLLVQNACLRLKLCLKPGIVGPSEVETEKCKRTLVSLATHFPCIESLDLSSTNVSNTDVLSAVQRLKRLKHLSLSNCTKVTSELPVMLYHFHAPYHCVAGSLESINLSRCFQLTEFSIFHVLQWSLTPDYRLKAVAFGKMTINEMNHSEEIAQFLERVDKMRHEKAASIPESLRNTAFHWSPLRILTLNNVEKIGLHALDLIVKCCPCLKVLGLGGSTIDIPETFESISPFGLTFASMLAHLDLSLTSALTNTEFCPAWIAALVTSLPNLWLLELTFFPRSEIDIAQRLISDRIIPMTPQQEQHFCMIDFNDAQSVEFYHSQIAESFREFLGSRAHRRSFSSDFSKFEDFPASFLDIFVTTASSTSRGGSMLAPNSVYTFSQTPLHCAAEQGDDAHIQALIRTGVILELRGRGGGSPLLKASREGHVNAVLLLLEAQVDPLTANRHDETSLYIAALRGHTRVVDVIVSFCEFYGIDWKQSDVYKDGWTPLMAAAVADRCDVAKCLLSAAGSSASALTRMKNRYHQTALHIAAYRGCVEMMELLVESGGTQLISEIDTYGRSAIIFAQHHEAAMSLLLQKKPDRRRTIPRVDFRARWHRWITERHCPLDYLHSAAD